MMTAPIAQNKRFCWLRYGMALLAVGVAATVRGATFPFFGTTILYLLFFLPVILVALYAGLGPGLLATGLSAIAASYWMEPVGHLLVISRTSDQVSMAVFVITNLLIVWICEQRRAAIQQAALAEASRKDTEIIAQQAETLRAAEQRLAFALEVGGIDVWDLDALPLPGLESSTRPAITGDELPFSQWTYEIFLYHVLEEDRAQVHEHFRRAIETHKNWNFECRVRLASGEMRWVWAQGKRVDNPPRIIGLVQDITERKRAEESLREGEERYRAVFETAVDTIITINEQGTIVAANPASEQLFGYRTDELLGQNVSLLMPAPYKERHNSYLENYLSTGIKKIIGIGREVEGLRKDGSTFPMRLAVSEMTHGGQRMFTGQMADITERKQVEDALKQAKEKAEEANIAKDRFLAILSHELRTPLTPALMIVNARETDATLAAEVREDLGTVRRNLELEARLIDDLLDLNRLARGKIELHPQPRDLHLILQNVLAICQAEIDAKNLTLRVELTATDHNVNCDAGRLQQVFWNLIKNSTKFTPSGGSITLRSSNPQTGSVRVEVSDTGIGFNPQIIPRLFVAFEQGETGIPQHFGGLGLGLAICKASVDLHGGNIWAESAGPGKGALFGVELPTTASLVTKENGVLQAQTVAQKSRISARNLKILLVEDNPDTLQILSRLLEKAGYNVATARNMASALTAAQEARKTGKRFDLLITDLGLPDGDGRELMRQLRERDGLKGIALSGYGMEEDLEKSRAVGFAEHLTKPVTVDHLKAAIERVTAAS